MQTTDILWRPCPEVVAGWFCCGEGPVWSKVLLKEEPNLLLLLRLLVVGVKGVTEHVTQCTRLLVEAPFCTCPLDRELPMFRCNIVIITSSSKTSQIRGLPVVFCWVTEISPLLCSPHPTIGSSIDHLLSFTLGRGYWAKLRLMQRLACSTTASGTHAGRTACALPARGWQSLRRAPVYKTSRRASLAVCRVKDGQVKLFSPSKVIFIRLPLQSTQ